MMVRVFDQYVPARTVLELLTDFTSLLMAAALSAFTLDLLAHVDASDPAVQAAIWLPAAVFASVILMLCVAFGAYQRDRVGSLRTMAICAALSMTFSTAPLYFFFSSTFFPDEQTLRFLGFAYLYQFLGLMLIRLTFRRAYRNDFWSRNVLIVGCGPDALATAADIMEYGGGSYRIAGFYPSTHESMPTAAMPAPLFSNDQPLEALVQRHRIEEIVVTVRERRGGALSLRQLLECRISGVPIYTRATFSDRLKGEIPLDSLKASWLIYGDGFAQGFVRTVVKRVFDWVVSLAILAVTWPIMLVAALAIFFEDGGPVLFRQQRTGLHGKPFMCLKFRSMRTDAENDGVARWAQVNDTRITRVGKFIRKTRIDEFPQIFNVLKGDMSLVGPRPERPSFVEQLTAEIPFYAVRHCVKPGVTGWAQVRFSYGASLSDARRKLQFDLYYVKNHSLFLDLLIILETVRVVIFREGAR